ncbi:acyl-CoA thioesterase [Embleya sp. AB8]|uniref:acyl-CoA thioesterase n=1 Tax=Embleya sp. AB8 TaxID=3156304 RepID=UPI003C7186AC
MEHAGLARAEQPTTGQSATEQPAGAPQPTSLREISVDRSWWSWAGVHGGYLAALGLDAMREDVLSRSPNSERPVRTVTTHFLRPVDQRPFVLATTIEHAGRGTSMSSFRTEQQGELALFGSAVFGARRPGPAEDGTPAPSVPPADECAVLDLPLELIPFPRQLEIRPATSTLPLSGAAEAELTAWIRFADGRPLDAAAVLVLTDALPPALFARWTRPRPVPSVELTVHFGDALDDGPLDGWALVRIRAEHAGNGWAVDDSAVWTADGRLLALGRQARRVLADPTATTTATATTPSTSAHP